MNKNNNNKKNEIILFEFLSLLKLLKLMKQIDASGFSKVFLRQLVFTLSSNLRERISLSNHLFFNNGKSCNS